VGLDSAGWRDYTHIAKLDGDIELPPRYFEQLLEEFARDPTLGLAGGVLQERDGSGWSKVQAANDYHVRGGLKCYSRECLEAIGGIQERLGWDAMDEIYARMRGYRTRTVSELVARHHRPTASADGMLRGRARHGQCAYMVHFALPWVTLRAFKVARERPRGLSGVVFLYGYVKAAILRVPQVDDPEFRRFVRQELRHRARGELARRVPRGRGLVSLAGRGH
jgi:GT2 family glycosyltransferase